MLNDDPAFNEKDEINYYFEDIDFELENQELLTTWIKDVVSREKQTLSELSFIFCSDSYLHQINISYLKHDTLTDVITFPYSTVKIHGDIFISIQRVHENALTFALPFGEELSRVMIHGVLHLLGFKDKSSADKELMTQKENAYLSLLNGMKLDI